MRMVVEGLPGHAPDSSKASDSKEGNGIAAVSVQNGSENATPSLSPGAGAGESPKSNDGSATAEVGGHEMDLEERAPIAPALAVASPITMDLDVPTPRGIDQMSPDGNKEYREYKDTACLFCAHRQLFKGYTSFKAHVFQHCEARPQHKRPEEIGASVQQYWNEQPCLETDELAQALAADPADADATDVESQSDDDGPRSGEVQARARDTTGTRELSDSDYNALPDRTARKAPNMLFDDVSNGNGRHGKKTTSKSNRQRRQAGRPQRYAMSEEDEEEYDLIVAPATVDGLLVCSCGKACKNSHGLKIHQNKSGCKAAQGLRPQATVTDPSQQLVFTCDMCGDSRFVSQRSVNAHKRHCRAKLSHEDAHAENGADDVDIRASQELYVLRTSPTARNCLVARVRENELCGYKGRSYKALKQHMKFAHNIQLTSGSEAVELHQPLSRNGGADSSVENEVDTQAQALNSNENNETDTPTDVNFHYVHGRRRACDLCPTPPLMFDTMDDLIAHALEAHNTRMFTSKQEMMRAMSEHAARPSAVAVLTKSAPPTTAATVSTGGRLCSYCNVYKGYHGPGLASHERACKLKHDARTAALAPAPVAPTTLVERELEMDENSRWCLECGVQSKSYRALCLHYKKEHNAILIKPTAQPAEETMDEEDTGEQTDLEEVDETEAGRTDTEDVRDVEETEMESTHHPRVVEVLNDQVKCMECDYVGKSHKNLKIHMKTAHKMHVTSIEPLQRLAPSKRPHTDNHEVDNDALVPVKKLSRARDVSRALVSVPSSAPIAPVNVTNVTELIDAFKALSEAHERLAQSHKELARAHEVAIAENDRHFSLMDSARGRSRELVTDPSVTINRIRPPGYSSPPIVTFGRLVWLANITASDLVDPTTGGQMRQALVNLVQLLVEAGTDALHLTSVTVYLNDIRDMYEVFGVMDKFFTECGISEDDRPMRTALQSQASKDRTLRVELRAEAVLPGKEETALREGVPTPRALANA